jgi:hypothetical protein
LALGAVHDSAWAAAVVLSAAALLSAWRTAVDCGLALRALDREVQRMENP